MEKRRYAYSCGKRFYEDYSFLPRYFQRTSRLTTFIAAALHDTASVSSIAEKCNVSVSTVNRILDTISVHRPTLSRTIAIDEFKGNAGGENAVCNNIFHVLLVWFRSAATPHKHRVLYLPYLPYLHSLYQRTNRDLIAIPRILIARFMHYFAKRNILHFPLSDIDADVFLQPEQLVVVSY